MDNMIEVGSPFFMYLNECEEQEKAKEKEETEEKEGKNFLDKIENF
jgi:hypothetical protein